MLLKAVSRSFGPGAGTAMVRRSDGWSVGDRGFKTQFFGVLSMAAGGVAEPAGDRGSDRW